MSTLARLDADIKLTLLRYGNVDNRDAISVLHKIAAELHSGAKVLAGLSACPDKSVGAALAVPTSPAGIDPPPATHAPAKPDLRVVETPCDVAYEAEIQELML